MSSPTYCDSPVHYQMIMPISVDLSGFQEFPIDPTKYSHFERERKEQKEIL